MPTNFEKPDFEEVVKECIAAMFADTQDEADIRQIFSTTELVVELGFDLHHRAELAEKIERRVPGISILVEDHERWTIVDDVMATTQRLYNKLMNDDRHAYQILRRGESKARHRQPSSPIHDGRKTYHVAGLHHYALGLI